MTNPSRSREPDGWQQWRSATHYVPGAQHHTARLQPTLVLVARSMGFPAAMINILDRHVQHSIAVLGEGYPASLPREETFCDVVVRTGAPLTVSDALGDQRFAGLSAVAGGQIRSYVGVPLFGRESLAIGTLCVVDGRDRVVESDDVARLAQFGNVVEDQLDLIRRLRELRVGARTASAELASALARGDIVPWYQPIVELSTDRVAGFEALARWVRPDGSVEEPTGFIPIAEDSDLIIDLDLSIIRQALADLKLWQISDPALYLSVNLSSRQFDHPDWLTPLLDVVREAGVSPRAVHLELTETARLSAENSDGLFVRKLQDCGFRVWLDDFGTGWSCLDDLLRLPADGLKIDRALSSALGTRIGDALLRSITGLTRELGMDTTIEGIESPAIADHAAALGCRNAQGYHWSRPLPASQVAELVRRVAGTPAPMDPPAGRPAVARSGPRGQFGGSAEAMGRAGPFGDGLAVAVLDAIPDATAVLDHSGVIVAVNHAWRMFALDNGGTLASTGVGVNYLQVCTRAGEQGSVDARQVATDLRAVLAGTRVESELEYPCPSVAARKWFTLRITRLTGPMPGAIASHVNITRRKMAEDELAHAASHDPLTGLANRTLLHQRLTKSLARRARHRIPDIGVLYIDLDGFKAVNDTFGHSAGDEVLLAVSHRLRTSVGPECTIARLGGDEFAVLLPLTNADALSALSRKVQLALAQPHQVHGRSVAAAGSVGAYLATPGDDATETLRHADHAMYREKRRRNLARQP